LKNQNLVCTSIDDNYLWPWMVTVYSAVMNCEVQNFRLILANINGLLSDSSILIATEFCAALELELEIVDIDTSLNPTFKHQFNITVYSRLFLMEMLDEDFLWLDADLLLMPGWDRIFLESGDDSNKEIIIYGVRDSELSLEKLSRNGNQAYIRTKGRYVNCGVIKISVKKWKKLKKEENWREMAINLDKFDLTLPDQDIINYLCSENISLMPGGFNYIAGDTISFRERIYIKHYAGFPKPWTLDKAGKELLLGAQGTNYFSPRSWVTQSSDAFLHYPMYWQVEDELIIFLKKMSDRLANQCSGLRLNIIKSIDLTSRVKNLGMKMIARRYR